jgi:uncharacterized protein (TIGR03083 family)
MTSRSGAGGPGWSPTSPETTTAGSCLVRNGPSCSGGESVDGEVGVPIAMTLSEKWGVGGGSERIASALFDQRCRFHAMLEGLPRAMWAAPTRCSEWSVDDVARHVVDVAEQLDDRLNWHPDHRPGRDGRFDPRETPKLWLAKSSGQPPEGTLQLLEDAREQEWFAQQRMRENFDELELAGIFGRRAHWSVFVLHVFFDAWVHERDVAIPLGIPLRYRSDERVLIAMYALLLASQPAALDGSPIHASVVLYDDSEELGFELSYGADGIVVETASPVSSPAVSGEFAATVDSLVGRGPHPSELLRGDPAVILKLSRLRDIAA